jgi:THO complex subunit 4
MSGKLDQSLDQIMKDTKPAGGRARGRGRPVRIAKSKAKAAIAAPTGGVQKNKAAPKAAPATIAALAAKPTAGESKVLVSNLPEDVTETLIKVR